MALSGDGSQALVGCKDGSAILWKTADGQMIQRFRGHFSGRFNDVCSVALSRDGKHVVTGSWDKTARLWDVASGKICSSLFMGTPEMSPRSL